jgi:glycosyltransferase involved in cell wall biosynthesis
MTTQAEVAPLDRQRPRVAYLVRSFPRLSQTHILNEILGLERLGYGIAIFGMTPSGESLTQEAIADLKGPVEFLDGALRRPLRAVAVEHLQVFRKHPIRYVATAVYLGRRPRLTAGYTTTTRWRCFLQAAHLATRLQDRRPGERAISHLHSHFAHDPALIALLTKKLTGIPFSFTAHARDMYQIPPSSLAERIKHASAVVTICQVNIDYMQEVAPGVGDGRYRLVHTGINTHEFRPIERSGPATSEPRIVVVSRLVEKKGLLDLVAALHRLKEGGRRFRCAIYGDGPLREVLSRAISEKSLEGEVQLAGAATLASLRKILPGADLFALTPFVTDDGDREGIPSSILEAMACGVPVVSTRVGGIPEAVIHGRTGLLAEPRDVGEIAGHLETLLGDGSLRRRMGVNARETIERGWSAPKVAIELANVFQGGPPGAS